MAEHPISLKDCFNEAELHREKSESGSSSKTPSTQSSLAVAISKYEQCLQIANEISLFSSNEELEDVASGDLKYFLIHFRLGQLIFRLVNGNRKNNLLSARRAFEAFLARLDSYRILDGNTLKAYERYQEEPSTFSTVDTINAGRRRDQKIANLKAEKALREKLERLRRYPQALNNDDGVLRDLYMTEIFLHVQQTFQSLESISQELNILAMAPSVPQQGEDQAEADGRISSRASNGYSERLDQPLSQFATNGRNGPILNGEGRPMRPFTLLDTRQRIQNGVFRPDHSLPTMTIDEYLEEERKRGGMINGGGPQSQQRAQVDEDDMDKADEATVKAREWDEFVEDNPKGSGNKMNLG